MDFFQGYRTFKYSFKKSYLRWYRQMTRQFPRELKFLNHRLQAVWRAILWVGKLILREITESAKAESSKPASTLVLSLRFPMCSVEKYPVQRGRHNQIICLAHQGFYWQLRAPRRNSNRIIKIYICPSGNPSPHLRPWDQERKFYWICLSFILHFSVIKEIHFPLN